MGHIFEYEYDVIKYIIKRCENVKTDSIQMYKLILIDESKFQFHTRVKKLYKQFMLITEKVLTLHML